MSHPFGARAKQSYAKCAVADELLMFTYFIVAAAMAAQLLAGGGNANLISAIQVRHRCVGVVAADDVQT